MKIPRLLAISSPGVSPGETWRQWCEDLAATGVDGLQVRRKSGSDRELLDLTLAARAAMPHPRVVLVNTRCDVALAGGADGVHLPASGLPPARLRATCDATAGRPFLIGRSAHSVEEVCRARDDGADFALYGPVFETPSKAGVIPARGLAALARAADCGLPVLALGGIDFSNARRALEAGAWGLAAIRWFADPVACASEYAALRLVWQAA